MQTLIDSLLAYSRVTTQAGSFCRVDLSQVINEVLGDLEVSIEQSQASIEVSEMPVIEANPLQMRQLFQNLIANALKFHKTDRAPVIRILSKRVGGNQVEISVIDNGIGFEMEQSKLLFQPFHRLVNRGEYEGTGFGLAICQKIVEHHLGWITVQSIPGEGSTFIVTLPIKTS